MDKSNSGVGREIIGHLLQLHGVLKTFSVSRLLSADDLKKFKLNEAGKPSKSKKVFQENLKKYLESNKNESVPGTIYKKQILTMDDSIRDTVSDIFSKHSPTPKNNRDNPKNNTTPSKEKPTIGSDGCKKVSKLAVSVSNKLFEENLTEQETAQVLLTAADMLNLDIDAFMRALDGDDDIDDDDDENNWYF